MIMKEDKGKWEEIIRSKIYDFEVETRPEDWDALSAKLLSGKTVRLIPYRKILFTAAATAAVVALVVIGGLYLFTNGGNTSDTQLAIENNILQSKEIDEVAVDIPVENIVEKLVEKPVNNFLAFSRTKENKTVETGLIIQEEQAAEIRIILTDESEANQNQESDTDNQQIKDDDSDRLAEKKPKEMVSETPHIEESISVTKRRRWGFGMGTGGFTTGSISSNPGIVSTSRLLRPDEYILDRDMTSLRSTLQNSTLLDPLDGIELPTDDAAGEIKHKTPVSGGLGISYYLSDRWALQSGAVYTLLRSKGSYTDEAGNPADWKQNLHFIGVPLSVSYSIAEWKRINFYVSAGGMGEWNVAGKIKRTAQVEGLEVINSENLHMKNPLWSVNSRAGAVYPIWRFFNLYAEAGVAYYFDNKSSIETIRSDKPFNVSLQAGIRLGF